MKRYFEKWYVLFMLMRIARHNRIREKFENKYDDYFGSSSDSGEFLESLKLSKCYERNKCLYKHREDKSKYMVANRQQRDDFGLYEYVDQHCGYCEDDYYGTIYRKIPIKNRWLESEYHC